MKIIYLIFLQTFSDDNDMENSIHLEPNQTIENRGEKSYLIVWHVSQR